MRIINLILLVVFLSGILQCSSQNTTMKPGEFEALADIGSPSIPGKASYNESLQKYSITASGSNIWFGEDSFSMLWKKLNGNFIVQTQIEFIGEGHELHRKTGIMFRQSSSKSSPMVAVTVHAGDGLASLQFREKEGEDVEEIKMDVNGPTVLQLEKRGDTYIMSAARAGETYQTIQLEDMHLGDEILAGIFVCSHSNDYTEEVHFSNTRIYRPAPDTLIQYEQYLGSLLEVVDLETGNRKVLAHDEGSWQAPNWSPDGENLMYNAGGKLFNFHIASGSSTTVNTGFALRNNNDHVLSFDGLRLGISHHAEEDNGQSVIYTLPATGGTPERVTAKSPSYLHGWSPDNKYLIYTAERNGDYDIYRIAADGGEEEQLTTTKGLDDGSEYSPDGKYIYFCSTRTGTMQIWRMDPDGTNQVQLTFDELNDWFPHVSPDNKYLVFVSFPEEVPADKHPFYQQVYLRKIPVEGGEPEVLSYLYGGQGTINVASWSPDSRKLAFISNGTFLLKQ